MARKKYPSDARRGRPSVRVHLTLKNHPTYGHVFDDPALRGMWLGVLYVARQAFAGETDDWVTIGVGDLYWITGRKDVRRGVFWLRKLCDAMNWQLEVAPTSGSPRPDVELTSARRWRVQVRNLKRKQGLNSTRSTSPSTSTSTSTIEESSATPSRRTTPSGEACDFARKFRSSLKARTPDAKLPKDMARWEREADRMLRVDGRELKEAIELATWLFNDSGPDAHFWRGNVRAVPKFRKQYETLREHRARAQTKGKGKGGHGRDVRSAIARVAERHGAGADGDEG